MSEGLIPLPPPPGRRRAWVERYAGRPERQDYPAAPAAAYGPAIDPPATLMDYLSTLRRRKGVIALCTALGALAAILLTLPQRPVYRARTSVEILNLNEDFLNMRNVTPTAPAGGAYSPEIDIQTQSKLMQSRSVVERAIEKMDLEKRLLSGDAAAKKRPGLAPRDRAVFLAATALRVRPQANTRVIELTADSRDPQLAADLANAVAAAFGELSLEKRWQTSQRTSDWLATQMRDLKGKLENAEQELQRYARSSNLMFTSERENIAEQRLKQLQDELSRAQADRIAKQSKYELAATAPPDSLPEVLDDLTLKDYQVELTTLRRQLADLSSSFTAAHPKMLKLKAQIASVEAAFETKRANILKRIRNEYESASRRENLLRADYAAQAQLMAEQAAKVARYNVIRREVDTTRQLYDSMFQRVKEAALASAMQANTIQVIDRAVPPPVPYKPNLPLNTAFGLFSGFGLGVVLVFIRERSRQGIRAPGETARYIDVSELAVIPSGAVNGLIGGRPGLRRLLPGSRGRAELAVWEQRGSLMAESFRVALASILLATQDGERPQVIVVSSANPEEGKTTVASNLAIALAQMDHSVLLVDGDIRKPRLHEIFDADNRAGLSEILAGKSLLTVRETRVPNLWLLPGGTAGDANLLFGPQVEEFLRRVRTEFDTIVIDTSPLLLLPDARMLARHADGLILVVRAHKTGPETLRLARERLADDGIYLLGTILNDWNPEAAGFKQYRKYYGSGA